MHRIAVHESSQSEVFLKIGVPNKYAKSLNNIYEQVIFAELQAAGVQLPKM